VTAIVPSAGRSKRMKTSMEKPFLLLNRKPILAHTLLSLERSPLVQEIILLVRRSRLALAKRLVGAFGLRKVKGIYAGGETRFESVWRGLQKVSSESDYVLIHDGVRPLLSEALIRRVLRGARRHGAAVPVVPVNPTVKRGRGRFVRETLIRKELWEVQTPQAFRTALILKGYQKAKKAREAPPDCAATVERLGKRVYLVAGDPKNIKITTREEWALAMTLLKGGRLTPCAWE